MTAPDPQPTLAEFLLARIGETAERVTGGALGVVTLGYWGESDCECRYVDHVLAECEVKRKIVAVCLGDEPPSTEFDPRLHDERVPALVLQALAQPYADHELFRAEWAL